MLWERMIPPLEQLSLPQLSVFSPNRAKRHFWTDGILSLVANRSSFLIGELLLGKLSEAVVVQGNAPHDRPGFLVSHLIGNRASFLCTKAPMVRIPNETFWMAFPRPPRGRSSSLGLRRVHRSKEASGLGFVFPYWITPRCIVICHWIIETMVEAIVRRW